MKRKSYYVINLLTLYRIVAAPVLLYLIFNKHYELFGYLLPVSFLTDLIDGWLARKFKVSGALGARFDSLADDINMLVAIIGLIVFKHQFLIDHLYVVAVLLLLYISQTIAAFIKYGKLTSYHTYTAKVAAILQGVFMCTTFLSVAPNQILFYTASVATGINLLEELLLTSLLKRSKSNVKGLYWIIKEMRQR